MGKIKVLFCILLPILSFCQLIPDETFEQSMGDASFVETKEDKQRYAAFKHLYESNLEALKADKTLDAIPKAMHFVWLGFRSVPVSALKCMQLWAQYHPDWNVYFWSDLPHPIPDERIQCKPITYFSKMLPPNFREVNNKKDQSFLLRLLILREFGGLSIDCDVKPAMPIDAITSKVRFIGVADGIKQPFTSSSVNAATFLIGAAPHHPIIEQTYADVCQDWAEVNASFTRDDNESFVYRCAYHTYVPFTKAILEQAKDRDLILPAGFYSRNGVLGHHLKLQSWLAERKTFEEEIFSHLNDTNEKRSESEWYIYLVCISSCALLAMIFSLSIFKRNTLAK